MNYCYWFQGLHRLRAMEHEVGKGSVVVVKRKQGSSIQFRKD
jgi:hypothetical protein